MAGKVAVEAANRATEAEKHRLEEELAAATAETAALRAEAVKAKTGAEVETAKAKVAKQAKADTEVEAARAGVKDAAEAAEEVEKAKAAAVARAAKNEAEMVVLVKVAAKAKEEATIAEKAKADATAKLETAAAEAKAAAKASAVADADAKASHKAVPIGESKRISGSKSTLGVRAMIMITLFYVSIYCVYLIALTIKVPDAVPAQFSVMLFLYIPIAGMISATWGDGRTHDGCSGVAQKLTAAAATTPLAAVNPAVSSSRRMKPRDDNARCSKCVSKLAFCICDDGDARRETITQSSSPKCKYVSEEGRTCSKPAVETKAHCVFHTCSVAGCTNTKSSRAEFCTMHEHTQA